VSCQLSGLQAGHGRREDFAGRDVGGDRQNGGPRFYARVWRSTVLVVKAVPRGAGRCRVSRRRAGFARATEAGVRTLGSYRPWCSIAHRACPISQPWPAVRRPRLPLALQTHRARRTCIKCGKSPAAWRTQAGRCPGRGANGPGGKTRSVHKGDGLRTPAEPSPSSASACIG